MHRFSLSNAKKTAGNVAMSSKTFPEQLTRTRCQVYLTEEKRTELLKVFNSLTPEEQKNISNHSDFYFFLLNRKQAAPDTTELQHKFDFQQIQFAEYLNALQNFARKVSADLHRETDGLFSRTLTLEELCEAMQNYAADETGNIFPSEKFVEKLLSK
ncbi:MAG: hypothetical protein WCI04_07130 [archaeon]